MCGDSTGKGQIAWGKVKYAAISYYLITAFLLITYNKYNK